MDHLEFVRPSGIADSSRKKGRPSARQRSPALPHWMLHDCRGAAIVGAWRRWNCTKGEWEFTAGTGRSTRSLADGHLEAYKYAYKEATAQATGDRRSATAGRQQT